MSHDIKDIHLAEKGQLRIDWARNSMGVLDLIRKRFAKERPLEGVRIAACLHVTTETANLVLTLKEGDPSSAIVPELSPEPGELVVRKTVPSAFFATSLAPWLTQRGVRTLVVAGCVTSGCVRASVVDAMSLGFRPLVLSDCVGDRALGPHNANLFDIEQKYASVMTRDQALTAIDRTCSLAFG